MILLDTNVVSDGLRVKPNARVQDWLDSHQSNQLWISSVTVAELQLGVEAMPDGRRKRDVRAGVDRAIALFGPLCVAFDALAAYEFARIIAARRRIGRPIEELDAQIAAIARSGGFTVATLDRTGFEGIEGLKVIDPSA